MDERELKLEKLQEEVISMKATNESRDREIKEIKSKLQSMTNVQNGQAVINQKILSEQEYTNKTLKTIVDFMEDLKAQPKKERDKFIWIVVSLIMGAVGIAVGAYIQK